MDFEKKQAIYMQIADYIIEQILAVVWKPGDRIPSIREMAETIAVNPNTITRTYNYLQEQDIIYNKRGIGFFVSEDAFARARKLKKDDFVNHYLPQVFKTMQLLNLEFDDLRLYYHATQGVES